MPAATADTLTLPRVTVRDRGAAPPVKSVTTAPSGLEGEGFPVRRAFAGLDPRDVDPFIMMDQMGEVEYAPGEPKGTPWHPHRGFETVHVPDRRASSCIRTRTAAVGRSDGGTQYMTAGDGILHIETPPEQLVKSGGLFHGIQLWINLPGDKKRMAPHTRTFGPGRHHGVHPRRWRPGPCAGGQGRRPRGPGLSHARSRSSRDAGPGRHARTCPGGGLQRPGLRAHGSGGGLRRSAPSDGPAAVLVDGDTVVLQADALQSRAAPTWMFPDPRRRSAA